MTRDPTLTAAGTTGSADRAHLYFARKAATRLHIRSVHAAKATLVMLALLFTVSERALSSRKQDLAIREAVNKSLILLQHNSSTFMKNSGCESCHSQSLSLLTFLLARRNGFQTDNRASREAVEAIVKHWSPIRESLIEGRDGPTVIDGGYSLVALTTAGYPSDKMTDALVYHLAGKQVLDGHWRSISYRPPLEYSEFTATALCVRALQVYAPKGRVAGINARIKRARVWLIATTPKTTEEKVFRLLGLHWSGADSADIRRAARELLSEQHSDGGWSQLSTLGSDAYATGQVLVALNETNSLSVTSRIYRQGVSYLQRTQLADGSWEVQSRSFPVIPFVDSGFPHGKNQFISAAASNWATMALILPYAPLRSRVF